MAGGPVERAALLEVTVIDHLDLDINCTPVRQSRGNVENGEFHPVGILNQFAGDHLEIDNPVGYFKKKNPVDKVDQDGLAFRPGKKVLGESVIEPVDSVRPYVDNPARRVIVPHIRTFPILYSHETIIQEH